MLKLHNLSKVYRTDEVETAALDAVNIEIDAGAKASCQYCGALLYKHIPASLDKSIALYLTSLILFIIAGLATAVIYLISEIIWVSGIAITLVAFVMGGWHFLQSLWLSR